MVRFSNAKEAFETMYDQIMMHGRDQNGTKSLLNASFYIDNPLDRNIDSEWRKFNPDYAKAEWDWFVSKDPHIDKLGELYGKIPQIWKQMADKNGRVNSNYGYQWSREDQLDKVVEKLKNNPNTRQASISIYDGKEIDLYENDTPCTYAINFQIIDNKLEMSALMRSNDLVFGFCIDQWIFSSLQELVADRLGIKVGSYYHYASNMHIYERHYNLKNK